MEYPGELTCASNTETTVVRQTSVALDLSYNIFRPSGDLLVILYVGNKGMRLCATYKICKYIRYGLYVNWGASK